MKIFWSWQSDTPQNAGRHFVRKVIADLAHSLNVDDDTEDAERPETEEEDETDDLPADDGRIEVDHDTYGVGGSPPIADTILRKIRAAAVFVADVTPITETLAGKRVPNPNVMIELGYALRVLEHERIVLVMNGAEGAALKYLPFDLRHWRAPIIYKLRKDATDEQRLEAAAGLKAALRKAILPGLRLAEKTWQEEERRTNRMPELHVVLDRDVEGPLRIPQKLPAKLGVKSIEEIKKETPLLPLPFKRDGLGPSRISLAGQTGILAGLGHKKPVSQWTREETEGYNRRVEAYYASYARFLEERADFERLRLRSFQVNLRLENSGTLPATDIDVDVYFPEGIVLYDENGKFAVAPEPPEPPPQRPTPPGFASVSHHALDIPSLVNPGWMQRSTRVYPNERLVRFSWSELKHNHGVDFDTFIISFATADDIRTFEAEFRITAKEPIDPITGTITFDVVRSDD